MTSVDQSLVADAPLSTATRATARADVAHALADLPVTAHLRLATTLPSLSALEADWRHLEAHAITPTSVFQTYDWVATWCQTYAATTDLVIVVGYDRGELCFIWPLQRRTIAGIQILCWLTEPFGQYGDVICAAGQNPHMWVGHALRYLKAQPGVDLLRLRHVRADSTLATTAEWELCNARLDERAPYLDLTAFATESDYEQRYTSTQRKRRKKIHKHLSELGEVTFNALPIGPQSDAAICAAISEKNKWLAERGRMNVIMKDPLHAAFLKALGKKNTGNTGFEIVVSELKAGDTPVSWEIGFRFAGTHFGYITSHVNAMTNLSPGRLHMDLSQRAALKSGMARFDLMVPYDAHKESWSSACMPTQDYYLPLSWKGAVAGHAYLRHIRPFLRKLYYRMPKSILRHVTRSAEV